MSKSNNSANMASFGVMPAQNGTTLESFDSSEFSLIPEQNPQDEVGMHYSTNSTVLMPDLMSARFDLSEEEIQRRLFELAEDNKSLRETLQNSSAVMRSELSSIAAWHNNITSTMASLKVSLQEAQARVQELEKEKEELLKEKEEAQGENCVLSDEDSEYEIIQKKSKDTEGLRSELKEAELNIAKLKQKIEDQNLKIATLQNLYDESVTEKDDLKSKLINQDELNSRMNELLQHVASTQEKNHSLQSKVKQLEEKLHLQTVATMNNLSANPAEEYQQKANAIQVEHDIAVAKLQEQIKELEEKLAAESQAVKHGKLKNLEDKKLLSVLQANYDRVTKILQMQSRKDKQKTDSLDSERQLESRKNLEQIDSLTARLFDYQQRLEESEARVSSLTRELDLLKKDSEQPPILKAQLRTIEVLKIDLDSAVLAKESAQEEARVAQEQLRELQQAQATASFCSNCGAGSVHGDSFSRGPKYKEGPTTNGAGSVHGDSSSRGPKYKRRTHHKSESRSNPEFLLCPICQFGFTEIHALENHVETCIEKNQ